MLTDDPRRESTWGEISDVCSWSWSGRSKRARIEGVWAWPKCCWSPIGDLSVTSSQKVSHQSVTKTHTLVNLTLLCKAELPLWGLPHSPQGNRLSPYRLPQGEPKLDFLIHVYIYIYIYIYTHMYIGLLLLLFVVNMLITLIMYVYIYIYVCRERERDCRLPALAV